ncbi:hypothetical protein N1851_003840 [Merluccius polli]|uniref:Myb/SANT-like DNA-binding domain-containing protein n=1 Tax=Merluccius polli TaxID=89951 RepID=A0AA47PB89_MERPO|nr:hypothetical protein N1851_003840 [Merluccius polli]
MADLSGGKKEQFSGEETDLLMREVKTRKQTIYRASRNPPKIPEVKQAWEDVAVSMSSSSGITRTAAQCHECYDVRRRGKQKLAAHRKQLTETGGGPPLTTTEDLTSTEDIAASTLTAESIEGFGGLEVGVHGNAIIAIHQVSRRQNTFRQEDHPFLDLQQAGFNMLERELGGIRQSVQWVNPHLSHMEMLQRLLGRIVDSLGRQ